MGPLLTSALMEPLNPTPATRIFRLVGKGESCTEVRVPHRG
jgi:hypothetical protein